MKRLAIQPISVRRSATLGFAHGCHGVLGGVVGVATGLRPSLRANP
jgi:hypothetical protein